MVSLICAYLIRSSATEVDLGKQWYRRRAITFFVLMMVFLGVALCTVPLVIFAPEEGSLIVDGVEVGLGVIPFFFCWMWARRKERDPLAVLFKGSEVLRKRERRGG